MLTVVRSPSGEQEGEGAPKRRRLCVTRSLSDVERMRLRAALRNLRGLYGTWACLAEVMGMQPRTLRAIASGKYAGSPGTAMRAARAAGTTIERLLGRPVAADRCPNCGRGAP
ncbi:MULTISPECIES: helix-turn-helix domain-containing protein [Sorangium]|uniref:Helix-turn-helix transcriptional regulator n=1 Tax=Sorangium atrum TaxID=2995308 RepID=A0ABT5BYF9_9BACT|nr:helix-turn-helix transcriptional regulator [Sorangium aterium]MDC0679189.1 helix-turn-helix transcriptional regulator [Sorangium aterium]